MEYLLIFKDKLANLAVLPDDAKGRLLMAMLTYSDTGKEPELSGPELYAWPAFKQMIDSTKEKYEKKVAAGKAGGRGNKRSEATESTEKQTKAEESTEKQTEAEESYTEAVPEQKKQYQISNKEYQTENKEQQISSSSSQSPSSSDPESVLANGGVEGDLKKDACESGVVTNAMQAKILVNMRKEFGYQRMRVAMDKVVTHGGRSVEYLAKCLATVDASPGQKDRIQSSYQQRPVDRSFEDEVIKRLLAGKL